jgi:alkanesulfonate monooxygenase SsuD/methylene tetrahydromethanopterin reductase-like flavin-dependent oxidoreductase (luciferase family)
VRLGIGLTSVRDVATSARAVEAAGFDSVHCGEHLFFHAPTPHALTTLAVAAGATSRVRLVSAVTLAPLYPAAAIAKIAATLDVASAGRLDLGLGVGGEFPPEFAAVGVAVDQRGQRMDEALAILRRLFSGERVRYSGDWAEIENLQLAPPPVQPGGPPIWLAGRKGAALRRAGRYADVWMPYMLTPEMFAEGLAQVRGAASHADRDPMTVSGAVYAFVSVDRDGTKARRWAGEMVSAIYRQPPERFMPYLIAGTPDECAIRLREFEQAGASSAQLTLACPGDAAHSMHHLLADEVLPAVREPPSLP